MHLFRKAFLLIVLCASALLLSHGCASVPHAGHPQPAPVSDHFVNAAHGVVVSVSPYASDAGVSILRQGGNAVDAAVATAFVLAVAYPPAGNLGGGGFMLVHPAPGDGPPVAFDYRECAPAAATATMFAKGESQFTPRAVAVPGTVAGFALAHRRFGSLPWRTLLQPAIAIARDGFLLDRNLTGSLNITLAAHRDMAEFQRVFGKPGGGNWQTGDRVIQPDLARTLAVLADLGPDAFYTGSVAQEIVAEMSRGKGIITAADLANYRALERQPLTTRYRNAYDVYVPPPPSSGGTVLLEELNVLNSFNLIQHDRWSAQTVHVMAETMRRANVDRARYLGDPAFTEVPAKLIAPAYGYQVAQTIGLHHATPSTSLGTDMRVSAESHDTTQFSIIDEKGMAVANTYTLERRWGSRIVVRNMGFILNNDMWAFNLFPGVTNVKGDIGTPPNTIAPNKRPISSQTPTIVAQNGRVKLVTGSPGSRAIPHTVLGIMVSTLDYHIPLKEAVASPRISHQWFPDQLSFEAPERFAETSAKLAEMGHTIVTPPIPQGDAHSIWVVEPHHYQGVADQRINGKASGY